MRDPYIGYQINRNSDRNDVISVGPLEAQFGHDGQDTFTFRDTSDSFPGLALGGRGADAYVVNRGEDGVVYDSDGSSGDVLRLNGIEFDNAYALTLEGRHLLVYDTVNDASVTILDWRDPDHRIERVEFPDRSLSFQQAEGYIDSGRDGVLGDFSWNEAIGQYVDDSSTAQETRNTIEYYNGLDLPPLGGAGADLSGDGSDDVLWQNASTGAVGFWSIEGGQTSWTSLGRGGGNFELSGAGDFDGDGTTDLLWYNESTGAVGQWQISNGQASWAQIGRGGGNYELAGTGDFTGDGRDDILWINATNGRVGQFQISDGNPSWSSLTSAGGSFDFRGSGDFDGDGTDDLFWVNDTTGRFGQHDVDNGNAVWQALGTAGGSFSFGGAGDFDGDGTDELLWHNTGNGVVGFHDVGNGGTAWNQVGNAGDNFVVAGTGDYNGDGTDDVLWYNTANGNAGQFVMNNGQATWQPLGSGGNYTPLSSVTDADAMLG